MSYPIPNAALDDRLGFVGTSGSGKTYAAAVSIELNGSTMRARLAELRKLEAIEDLDRQRIRVQPWLADNWGREA